MAEHTLATVLRDYHKLNDQLAKAQEIRNKAFVVFDHRICGCPLEKMMSVYEGPWQELFDLDSSGCILEQYPDEIKKYFLQVSNASINRSEFEECLKPSREIVEKYLYALTTQVEQKRKDLLQLYDERFSSNDLSFIYTAPAVKDEFINFILS
ncbi:MAG: hypothetical protein HFJ58_07280 [Clostridia bacterium]|nr:hypothetical protein [Clostridia bacterium]